MLFSLLHQYESYEEKTPSYWLKRLGRYSKKRQSAKNCPLKSTCNMIKIQSIIKYYRFFIKINLWTINSSINKDHYHKNCNSGRAQNIWKKLRKTSIIKILFCIKTSNLWLAASKSVKNCTILIRLHWYIYQSLIKQIIISSKTL